MSGFTTNFVDESHCSLFVNSENHYTQFCGLKQHVNLSRTDLEVIMPQTFQMLRSFRSLLGSFSQTVGGHSLLPPTRQPSSDSGFPETFLHVPTTAGPCYCRRKLLVAGKRGGRSPLLVVAATTVLTTLSANTERGRKVAMTSLVSVEERVSNEREKRREQRHGCCSVFGRRRCDFAEGGRRPPLPLPTQPTPFFSLNS
nr:hypothetical protein Itr_chr12CG15390 [Ipomoea trifida]